MQKVLITGGAGFVGSNVAISLKIDNPSWHIISFDNLHRRGSDLNIARLKNNGVEFVHGDIRIANDLENINGFDLLIECSAEPSVLAGYHGPPSYLIQTNLVGTLNCLEVCHKQRADIIFLSTSRVYPMQVIRDLYYFEEESRFILKPVQNVPGVSEYGFSEDFPLAGIRSLYGATKLCSELMIQEYIAAYDLKGVINRCGVLTGPWQMGKVDQGFVVHWIAKHLWGDKLAYIGYGGKGVQVRDILHINDLYNLLCIQIDHLNEINECIFNVGGGQDLSISLVELTKLCQDITGKTIPITPVLETRKADIPFYVSDFRKVQEMTGWKPIFGIRKILEEIYSWLLKYEAELRPTLR